MQIQRLDLHEERHAISLNFQPGRSQHMSMNGHGQNHDDDRTYDIWTENLSVRTDNGHVNDGRGEGHGAGWIGKVGSGLWEGRGGRGKEGMCGTEGTPQRGCQ